MVTGPKIQNRSPATKNPVAQTTLINRLEVKQRMKGGSIYANLRVSLPEMR
jgi:hypothetical protein